MKIRMLHSCSAEGQHLEEGGEYDLPETIARGLVRNRRAEEVKETPKEETPEEALKEETKTKTKGGKEK